MQSSTAPPSKIGTFLKSLSSPAGWKAAGVGALGALAGFFVSSVVLAPFFDFGLASRPGLLELLLGQSLMFGIEGALLSLAILAWDNHASLRGRWHRDLPVGVALFSCIAFLSGGVGQLLYSVIPLTRIFPWLLAGAGIGAAIGILRRDQAQAKQGALGGAAGGLLGGLLVDVFLAFSRTDQAFALGSMLGVAVTGAMIALFMRAVQQTMQSAWVMGITTGPYEGKEYPLNTAQVTIGQTELNDIALYRDRTVPARAGKFLFEGGRWYWRSESAQVPVLIDGQATAGAELHSGSQIQLGSTKFVFLVRALAVNEAEELPSQVYSASPPVPPARNQVPLGWQLWHPQAPLQIGLEGVWTLGRSDENNLTVGDPAVSSRHARLEAHSGVLAVADVGSSNGTFINGARLAPNSPAILREGDRLTLGQTEFFLRQI